MMGLLCETAEKYGWNTLTDVDLLEIVTGDKERASVLCEYLNNNETPSVEGLVNLNIEGMGKGTAMKIKALAAYFSRRKKSDCSGKCIRSSKDLFDTIAPEFDNIVGEAVFLMLLDMAGHVTKKIMLSKGSLDQTLLDVRMVVKYALENNCSVVALAHNHPGRKPNPSEPDIISTKEIARGCSLMRITLVDHIIVTGNDEFYSFSDNNMLD